MSESDEEAPQLSAQTFAALQEFYNEQEQLEERSQSHNAPGMPPEDWQLSQFWYDADTASSLAQEVLLAAGANGSIACISCPTLYQRLLELKPSSCQTKLLEYDRRFSKFGEDFALYDFNQPLDLPEGSKQAYDVVIADPPFLSDECLCQVAITIKFMAKEKIILCTGAVMQDMAKRLLNLDVIETFIPKHTNNLANEFRCFTNYKPVML